MSVTQDENATSPLTLMGRRYELAVRKGVVRAAIEHKRAGVAMVTSVNGEVVLIAPEDIVIDYEILNAPYPEA